MLVGATVTTLAGSFIVFVLYLRPAIKAAERAAEAAERAAIEMEIAAQVGGLALHEARSVCSAAAASPVPGRTGGVARRSYSASWPAALRCQSWQEMDRTARMMQEDMPLTFQDIQRSSKEFEILGG